MWFISFITGKVGKYVGMVGAAIAFVLFLIGVGKKTNQDENDIEDLEEYIDSQERVNEVDHSNNVDESIARLSDRGQLRD